MLGRTFRTIVYPAYFFLASFFWSLRVLTRHPLSKREAELLCEKFQFLIGENFEQAHVQSPLIKYVVVAPFDDINKYIFIVEFSKSRDPFESLNIYAGGQFDVILIAEIISHTTSINYKDLDDYLNEKNQQKK